MKNKFSESEELGRYKFLQQISATCKDIQFTENQYDKIDVIWRNKNDKLFVGEIKYRSGYTSTNKLIVEQGVVLEKTKYDALNYCCSASGATPLYITIFSNNKMAYWDISKMKELKFVTEDYKFPMTTNGNNKKISKEVAYLPLSGGTLVNMVV